jgi:hypothetical protein
MTDVLPLISDEDRVDVDSDAALILDTALDLHPLDGWDDDLYDHDGVER